MTRARQTHEPVDYRTMKEPVCGITGTWIRRPGIIEDRRKDQQPQERTYGVRVAGEGFVLANPTGMRTHRSDLEENKDVKPTPRR